MQYTIGPEAPEGVRVEAGTVISVTVRTTHGQAARFFGVLGATPLPSLRN